MDRWAVLLVPAAVALLSLVAGCARNLDGPVGHGDPSAAMPGGGLEAPGRFRTAGAVRLPAEAEGLPGRVTFGVARLPLPVLLVGATAFVATHTALLAVDVRSGRTVATIAPVQTAVPAAKGWNAAGPPALADQDGELTVVTPMLVTVPVAGAKVPRPAVELVGVRPGADRRLWSVTVDVEPGNIPAEPAWDEQWLAVVGIVGTVAVLRVSGTTYGIDLLTRTPVWREAGFTAAAIVGDVVVGWFTEGATRRIGGLGGADGERRWVDPAPTTRPWIGGGGPRFAVVQGQTAAQGGRYLRIVEAATGRVEPLPANVTAAADRVSTVDSDAFSCRYDGVATTVCGAIWDNWNAAFDARSGQWLWEVRADTSIRLTAAWHGAVYGTSGGTRPVVLDARTGVLRERAAMAAPYLVNGTAGIGPPVLGEGIYAFPAEPPRVGTAAS